MPQQKNPFIDFKDEESNIHNPYTFNPFTVLKISKNECDYEIIKQKADDLLFRYEGGGRDARLAQKNSAKIANLKNALGYLEYPIQRLCFEILIADTKSADNEKGD